MMGYKQLGSENSPIEKNRYFINLDVNKDNVKNNPLTFEALREYINDQDTHEDFVILYNDNLYCTDVASEELSPIESNTPYYSEIQQLIQEQNDSKKFVEDSNVLEMLHSLIFFPSLPYIYDSVQFLGQGKKHVTRFKEKKLIQDNQVYFLSVNEVYTPVYFYKMGNRVVLCNTIKSDQFQIAVKALTEKGIIQATDHVIGGIDGLGAVENHIVTIYSKPVEQESEKREWQIFDSKTIPHQRFFKSSTFSLRQFFKALWLAIKPKPKEQFVHDEVQYHYTSLGTQSLFDTVSCGYHTLRNIQVIEKIVSNEQAVTRENILKNTQNPVAEVAKVLGQDKYCKHKVEVAGLSYLDYLKLAWQDSVQTLKADKESHFSQYFLGWPREPGIGRRIVYFFPTFAFILKPLGNVFRLVFEFPLNFLAQTGHWLKNRLIAWAPQNPLVQYLRSMLILASNAIYGLFKAAALLVRVFSAPWVSVAAAWEKGNRVLAVLSAVLFLAALPILIFVAAPAVLNALAPLLPLLVMKAITLLAVPLTKFFALVDLAIPAVTGALLIVLSGIGILRGLDTVINMPKTEHKKAGNIELIENILGKNTGILEFCNVSKLLQQNEPPNQKIDEFEIIDENQDKQKIQTDNQEEKLTETTNQTVSVLLVSPFNRTEKKEDPNDLLPQNLKVNNIN